jgi:hypothetical protein
MSESETMPPVVDAFTGKDEDAPYGRHPDGRPKGKPGRKPGQKAGTGQRRTAPAKAAKDYESQILGLFQIPAGVLAIAGMQKPVLAADSAAITVHAPPIASALNDLAHERPEVAAVLDKVLQVGPYGIVIAAVAPLAFQILCNHGALPPGALGTTPPEQLLRQFVGDMPVPTPSPAEGNGGRPIGDDVSS